MIPILVVIDEGSRQIKMTWYDPATNQLMSLVRPSNVSTVDPGDDADGNLLDSNFKIGGVRYYVFNSTDPATREETDNQEYQVSDANLALVHQSLIEAGFSGKPVNIIATLPINQFYQGNGSGQANKKRISDKKAKLETNDIETFNGVQLAKIQSAKISPESIPGWSNLLISDSLEVNAELASMVRIMVVDIGGTTIDMCIQNGVGRSTSRRTIDMGVFDVMQAIRDEFATHQIATTVTDLQMERLLRSKKFRNLDIQAHIDTAIRKVKNRIVAQMRRFDNDPMSFDKILFVGGGSALMGKQIAAEYTGSDNPDNVVIPEDCELFVAKGLLKNAHYTMKQVAEAEAANLPVKASKETA